MELRQFKYFVAIVDCGSLSRAAQQLFVAQSALSKQMAELEGELGTPLLLRSRNGVTVTEAGKVFYEYAQGITKQVGDAKAAVHVAADSVVGSVVAALPQSVSPMIALPLMRAAARRYPDVVFHLNEELTGNMADQLLRGRVDVAIFSPTMPAEDIAFTPLVEEDFVFLESPQDPRALPPGDVSIEEATARPLVWPANAHGHCTRWLVDAVLEAAGQPPARVAAEINSVYTLKAAVEAGLGATIMPLGLAQREVREDRLRAHRIDSPAMFRTLGLCVSVHLPTTNAKRAICNLIGDVIRDLCTSGQWEGTRLAAPAGKARKEVRASAPRPPSPLQPRR
ncbi:LysR substrate-binding domain-containing protein [Variovorax paradoxus]|jgi:LysR family nitrogen assimilation transcriptional regulator|uniref:Transcriptional regulator, LysR family n=1 Tax=Variovorax paradoxus (strain EPS) TaxID=595537 RepID=E6V962_VARPE|nr:LysR substrate-binding domain-containing protein [Variovorax paradoxus]ADU38477.1 transcriptional regulator, LysR family [Variovorax paradoxus EPS]